MKSKLVLFTLLLAGFATMASAQTSRYYAESAKDNYFVSVGVGAQVCVDPANSDYGLGKAITPTFNVSVGKLINPVWGVRGQLGIGSSKLFSDYNAEKVFNEVKQTFFNVRFDALFNISNAVSGYREDRLFDGYAFVGPGLTITDATVGNVDGTKAFINGSLGLGGKFNVDKNWDINVEVRGEIADAPFGDFSSYHAEGFVAVTAGATYYFGGKKFVKVANEDLYLAANGDIKKYKELLAKEQADHNVTKDELAKERAKKPVEVVAKNVEIEVAGPRAIFFNIGSSKIDSKGQVNIELAAEIMKANPDVKYLVNGYADKGTGSNATNEALSNKRAEAVYNALIKAGVNADQIEWKGNGGQSEMWNSTTDLSRVVVIEKAK